MAEFKEISSKCMSRAYETFRIFNIRREEFIG